MMLPPADETRSRRTKEPNGESNNEQSEIGEEDIASCGPPLPRWGHSGKPNVPDDEGSSYESEDAKMYPRKRH